MKKVSYLLLAGIFLMTVVAVNAQKLKSGSFKALKGQGEVNLQYDYSKMAVGKFKNSEEYVAKRVADMNKKEAGTGDSWAKKWESDRTERFHPMFEKNLNKAVAKNNVTFKSDTKDAKYTLIVRTTYTEPGFNVGVTRQNAYINMLCDLVETSSPGTVLGSVELKKVQSVNMMGYDYDTGGRIQSCYDRAGDWVGSFLNKNAFK